MIEVILHDIEAGTAIIQVVSGGVTLTDTYDLTRVFPGTKEVLETLGIKFDEAAQLKAIAFVGEAMERQLADGSMIGDPTYVPKLEVEPIEVKAAPTEAPIPSPTSEPSAVSMKMPKKASTFIPPPAPEIDKAARAAELDAEVKPAVNSPDPQKPALVVKEAFAPAVPDTHEE